MTMFIKERKSDKDCYPRALRVAELRGDVQGSWD